MYKSIVLLLLSSIWCHNSSAQTILKANGTTDTYQLITSVLAPGANPIEVPDCNHQSFGDHIDQVFDNDLNDFAFRFYIHVTPDNDRCQVFDRQRNEIKTYGQSPENLKGTQGEIVRYRWKFKLPSSFQSSSRFTHIHQLKSVGGDFDSMPMYTLTTRKGSPDQLELRYAALDNQSTVQRTNITPFLNKWVAVDEIVTYGENGTFSIVIKDLQSGTTLLSYNNPSIDNWRPAGEFVRPKWGIYRGFVTTNDLRDEQVLFADFSIEELSSLTLDEVRVPLFKLSNNPVKGTLEIQLESTDSPAVTIYDLNGRLLFQEKKKATAFPIPLNIEQLAAGTYLLHIKAAGREQSMKFVVSQ